MAIVSIALLLATIWVVKRNRPIALSFVTGTGLLMAMWYVMSVGACRHVPFFYFFFLISSWLTYRHVGATRFHSALLTWILAVQFAGGVYAWTAALQLPFSASQDVARYLKANHFDRDDILVGSQDLVAMPVCVYLDSHTQLYSPETKKFGAYVFYHSFTSAPQRTVQCMLDLSMASNKDVLGILNYSMNADGGDPVRKLVLPTLHRELLLLTNFTSLTDDGYWLYQIHKQQDQRIAPVQIGTTPPARTP